MASGLLESIDLSTQLAGHNRLALLLFRLGERQIFGINVFKVQEVIPCPALTWMPASHALVCGAADVRKKIIPIIDLRRAIGGTGPSSVGSHVIVAEYNRSVQGFLVHAVDRIIHVDVSKVEPPPRTGDDDGYLTAITRHGEELVEIIDVERVLADIVGAPALSAAVRGQIETPLQTRLKALVVDDSRVARTQIEQVLQQIGIGCLLASNGREALRQLQSLAAQGPIDEQLLMVISDVEMPDMDGYTLTTEIRRDSRLQGLYVLLHSSLSGVFNNAMVKKVGADRFIAKFGSDELAQTVLDRARQRSPA